MAVWPLPYQDPHSGETSMCLHIRSLLGVPIVRRDQCGCMTPTFSKVPIEARDKYGYITPVLSGFPW